MHVPFSTSSSFTGVKNMIVSPAHWNPGWQVAHVELPVLAAYLPRTHSVHDVMNGSAVYVPATHSAQLVPPAITSYFPGAHAAQTEAPVLAYVPDVHVRHVVPPCAGW